MNRTVSSAESKMGFMSDNKSKYLRNQILFSSQKIKMTWQKIDFTLKANEMLRCFLVKIFELCDFFS